MSREWIPYGVPTVAQREAYNKRLADPHAVAMWWQQHDIMQTAEHQMWLKQRRAERADRRKRIETAAQFRDLRDRLEGA